MTIAPPRTDLLSATKLAAGATMLEDLRPVREWINDGNNEGEIEGMLDTVIAAEHCKERYPEIWHLRRTRHGEISERHLIRVLLYHIVERSRT